MIKGSINMTEEFEIKKIEYENAVTINDIWNNPVVNVLKEMVKIKIPVATDIVDSTVSTIFEEFQRKKMEEFFDVLLCDKTVGVEDVKDITVIMEFLKMMDIVNHLIGNEKIKYCANLLKNSIKNDNNDINEFEECSNRLNELSNREIEILCDMYMHEKSYDNLNKYESKCWDDFAKKEFENWNISEEELTSIVAGMIRTGFIEEINIVYPNGTDATYYISEYGIKFLNKIN